MPERLRFKALLVFGDAERKKVERLQPQLVSHVREDYGKSTTYHDGKWVFVSVDSGKVVSDIKQLLILKRKQLLILKRKPNPGIQAQSPRNAPRAGERRLTRG